MNKSANIPHPPFAKYARRLSTLELCIQDAKDNCPEEYDFATRRISDNEYEWYAPSNTEPE